MEMAKSRRDTSLIVAALVLTVMLAGVVPAVAQQPAAQPAQQPAAQQATPPAAAKFTFSGDIALWTVAIKPDKTAAFEDIMTRVHEALMKSSDPQRQQQAAGWKVMKIEKPLADGNIAYVHVINPVVKGADYTVMQILYDAFPDERQALYEKYREAFAANLSLATGPVALDLGKAAAAPPTATQ